jgi:hypothetical protein
LEHQEETTNFDRVVAELQRAIIEQERALYSAKVIEETYNPTNMGRMAEPDAYGIVHGWCGDTMEIYLRLDEESVKEATFVTDAHPYGAGDVAGGSQRHQAGGPDRGPGRSA